MVHRGTAPFIATVVVVFAYCGLHVADVFQNVRRLRATVPGFPVFARLWPSVPIALAMVGVRLFMVRTLRPLGRAALPATKWEPEEYAKRVDRVLHVLFKLCYFVIATPVGWYILKDEPWMPPSMGGTGDVIHCWTNFPHHAMPDAIHWYYVVSLGYHLHSLLYQLGSTRRNDFWEMFLHHSCTLFLVVFSYMANLFRFGTLVFWLHDCGDISSYWVKAFVDTRYTNITILAYLGIMSTWGYLRLYVFPFEIIRCAIFDAPFHIPGVPMLCTLMCVLTCLHLYWYTLFIRMGVAFLHTGKTEDVIEDVATDSELVARKRVPC
ncbi:hypothetical protein PBRA_006806 [Plasmodiophora brassicae]|nr:hypothetical protein PBRA_006806 [Plasmodiophora brassicae]